MKAAPQQIGMIHFVGIGGIGMSGIAEVMHNLGYQVQGSDISHSPNVRRLEGMGLKVHLGHNAENLGDARVVVTSSAVRQDNPEVIAAREAKVPVVRRSEMLAELMRLKSCVAIAGTHGKTTTTSMVAAVLDQADFDPTVINGGIINAYGTNARLGGGEWMVVEADESDGTFVKIPATIAIVTNIDPEHLDFHGDFDKLRDAFHLFIQRIPFYGAAVMCADHDEVRALVSRTTDRRVITYGLTPQADVRAVDLTDERGGLTFAVEYRLDTASGRIEDLHLPMPGHHNVQNAVSAVTVGLVLGIEPDEIRAAFAAFRGVKRRFTHVGEIGGITVIDDYAHHPVEIKAVLSAARANTEARVIAVAQPHRYSRLAELFEGFCTCFDQADKVFVTPVFAAGEEPIEGASQAELVAGLKAHGHRHALSVGEKTTLPALIAAEAEPGDLVICLGAGDITHWAQYLADNLAQHLSPADPQGGVQ
ncbi:MAG: UDP-N-acetylmuramate--L-alanine ligase [Pseudomonadota bacterium]